MDAMQRRNLLLDLLGARGATSQADLVRALGERGVSVTQATVSRDLAAIGAVKSASGYTLPAALGANGTGAVSHEDALKAHAVGATAADSIVVIRTAPGHAAIIGDALDADPPEGVAGTIAGENTVFAATDSRAIAARLAQRFASLITGLEAAG